MIQDGNETSPAPLPSHSTNPQRPPTSDTFEARESQRRTAVDYIGQQGIRTDAWGMEVLKSLLIISVGALAGAAALLVNKDKLAGASSVLTYLGVAIALAFAAFVTGWLVHRTQLAQMYRNHRKFMDGASAEVYQTVSRWTYPWFWSTVVLTLASFTMLGCGAVGVLSLLRS